MNKLITTIGLGMIGFSVAFLPGCAIKQKEETVGQYMDSGIITTEVKSKILADKNLKDTTITVTTLQNRVQLSGFVNNNFQKQYATDLALRVEGVEAVTNSLIIKKHKR